ncbi:hypothetical protein A3F57_02525 [Candidatus Roizmanbacteria bacterium RIFCSPHIGHO2_12_FULL_36_11]|nr:MAG: hypothetical protein A3F57_02525 [Candidatus Roizmanbacteria bacterium RIFCSPHIGHO2_12_FULL_36_11]
MKIGFIVVLYKTPDSEIARLENEIISLRFKDFKIYFIDNTKNNHGYGEGVNKGIKKALIDKCGLLIVANPDISLKNLKAKDMLEAGKYFDLWGLSMKMHNRLYYGGEIDKIKLSGGLIEVKPRQRLVESDFVSGSLICLKKEVIDAIGYFDESYFMYYEDVDYCLRARQAGLRVGIDSKTSYSHFELSRNNPKKELLLSQAKEKFFNKYAKFWQKIYVFVVDRLLKPIRQAQGKRTQEGGKPQARFFVNFLSLNASSWLNKFLNFILFIFLVRYLKPNDYGIYALVWAQVSIFSSVVDLGTTSYGIVYLPSEKKEKFVSMFNLRLIIAIIIFFLTILAGFIMFKKNYRIVEYIFLTSFVIFSNMASGSYLIKNALQGSIYKSSIVSNVFNLILILFLSLSLLTFKSLPTLFILIFFFYNLYAYINYLLIKKDFKQFYFKIDLRSWKEFIRKSYIFVLIGFLAGLYFKIDIFLLQILKNNTDVGIYSAGYKFFEATLIFAASYNITRTPIFAKLAKKNFNLLVATLKKDLLFLTILGLAASLAIFWLSPLLLPYFLQGNYLPAIKVLRIVVFALPLILISSVFLNAMYVLKKAHLIVLIFLFQVLLNFLLNLIFIPSYSYTASAYITILSEIFNVVLLSVGFYFIGRNYENIS